MQHSDVRPACRLWESDGTGDVVTTCCLMSCVEAGRVRAKRAEDAVPDREDESRGVLCHGRPLCPAPGPCVTVLLLSAAIMPCAMAYPAAVT